MHSMYNYSVSYILDAFDRIIFNEWIQFHEQIIIPFDEKYVFITIWSKRYKK